MLAQQKTGKRNLSYIYKNVNTHKKNLKNELKNLPDNMDQTSFRPYACTVYRVAV